MKKIKMLFLMFAMLFIASTSFARYYAYCKNGKVLVVVTDGQGHVIDSYWESATCDGTSKFLWAWGLAVLPDQGNSGTTEATSEMYDNINGWLENRDDNNTDSKTDDIIDETISDPSSVQYYVDPFKLEQDEGEYFASLQNLSLYGLKIIGNPIGNGNMHLKILSDKNQTITVNVNGVSNPFSFSTSLSLTRGLNDVIVNVNTYQTGTASLQLVSSINTIQTNIIFN